MNLLITAVLSFLYIIPFFGSGGIANDLEAMNINFMTRGYFYAGSREDKDAPGGFGPSDNMPKGNSALRSVKKGELYLLALPYEQVAFRQKYAGMKVLLVNATNEEKAFAASDSRLSIVQEALDKDGKWKPVEYLPSSWCGNSRHRVFLGANEHWEFAAARYTGKIKTKLRFVLMTRDEGNIVSNEFEGSINPKQFTDQEGHEPGSIMDPYNN